jgi:hypothetical protein
MAQTVRVSCINKTDRSSAHERIRNIGGANPDGTRWRMPESQAIRDIKNGTYSFYVERPAGHRVRVIVATRLGVEYLKTEADGEQPDNLLALPECPN